MCKTKYTMDLYIYPVNNSEKILGSTRIFCVLLNTMLCYRVLSPLKFTHKMHLSAIVIFSTIVDTCIFFMC